LRSHATVSSTWIRLGSTRGSSGNCRSDGVSPSLTWIEFGIQETKNDWSSASPPGPPTPLQATLWHPLEAWLSRKHAGITLSGWVRVSPSHFSLSQQATYFENRRTRTGTPFASGLFGAGDKFAPHLAGSTVTHQRFLGASYRSVRRSSFVSVPRLPCC
jgi:hypothetical protein